MGKVYLEGGIIKMKFSNVLYFALGAYFGALVSMAILSGYLINDQIFSAPFTDRVYICAEVIK